MMKPKCQFKDANKENASCDLEKCPIYFGHVLAGEKTAGVCANRAVIEYATVSQKTK